MIQNCAFVFKKLRSYTEESTSICHHLTCCKEFTVWQGCLKMMPVNTKMCQTS